MYLHQTHKRKKRRLILSTLLVVMAIASFTAGVMSDEEPPSTAVPASPHPISTLAALATGNKPGNFTAPALSSPPAAATPSPAAKATNSVDNPIALRTATLANLPPATPPSPATAATTGAGDSIALRTATPTDSPDAASATASPATPTLEAQKTAPHPPAPTVTPRRAANASATDTIAPVADSISKTILLTNTQPASNTSAQSTALPTQTTLHNDQSTATPPVEGSQALLPATGQNVPPGTGASHRTRYFAIGLILLMLAGGVLAAPDKCARP